jgi:hypothetical protein
MGLVLSSGPPLGEQGGVLRGRSVLGGKKVVTFDPFSSVKRESSV